LWVPYFSVHFAEKQIGLNVYNHLRQFALLRQLSPPKEMITVTKEYLDHMRPADPRDQKEWNEHNMGRLGQIMKKKERARVLMNQKATSIADVAFVLQKHMRDITIGLPGFAKGGYKTLKARKRRRAALSAEEKLAEERAEQIASLEEQLDAVISADLSKPESKTVKILWQDMYDAQHAKNWPHFITHGQLRWTRNHIIGQEEGAAEIVADGSFEEAPRQ
jgi:hypothetical protein